MGCIGEQVESLGRAMADSSFSVAGTWATARISGTSVVPGRGGCCRYLCHLLACSHSFPAANMISDDICH